MEQDTLLYTSQVKRATSHMITGINNYFSDTFSNDKVLKNVPKNNTFTYDKQAIQYTQDKINHSRGIQKGRYENAITNLYRKFDFQFVNNVAHHVRGFQMLGRRLYNSGTNNYNQPTRFGKLNLHTGKQAVSNFLREEQEANRAFNGHQYSLFMHPNAYKKHLTTNMSKVKKYVIKHPWSKNQVPSKLFHRQPVAMRTLGLSDQNYYENAIKQQTGKSVKIPKGVYYIENGADIDSKNPSKYLVSSKKFLHLVNDFQRESDLMAGEDLRDSYLGYSREMRNSTTSDFKPTDYSKYGKPNQTFTNLYHKLNDPHVSSALRMSKATNFFTHYPKFADKLNIYTGKQAKSKLRYRINGVRRDMGDFVHVGLLQTGKHQIKNYTNKLYRINNNYLYTGKQLSNLNPVAKHLSLKALSQNIFATLPINQQKKVLRMPTNHKLYHAHSKWSHIASKIDKASQHHKVEHRVTHHKSRNHSIKARQLSQRGRSI